MYEQNYISNKNLIFRIIFWLLALSIVTLLLSTIYIKKAALNTLGEDDAKKTSQLVFETMYTRMQEGWSKEDLNEILNRLENIRDGMSVSSYRSHHVEELMGIVPEDKKIVDSDPLIQQTMSTGKEKFIIEDDGSIRFLYPMKVVTECKDCHINSKEGEVNGVLDIRYPPSDIKISLDMMTYYFIIFFIFFIIIFFYIFFFIINKKMVTPIVKFTNEIKRISEANDLNLQAEIDTNIEEIGTLQSVFNNLLSTTKFYYDKLIGSLYVDRLTNASNFIKLQKDLQEVEEFTFLLLSIDKFKQLNSFFGTNVADYVLIELVKLLEMNYSKKANIYRVNAGKFALLFHKDIDTKDIEEIVNTIHTHKFNYKFTDIIIQVKIGCVTNDSHKTLEKAELALSQSKKSNKIYTKYDDSLRLEDEYMKHMVWSNKIEEALDNDQVVPYFQPMKSVKSGKIEKYETLMRLIDSEEVYTPEYFIEIAQRANLYARLTQTLIRKTFEYFTTKDVDMKFSINMALEDITNQQTLDILFKHLLDYKYSSNVTIELLETQEISDFEALNSFINQVKQYGAKIAIDDFGSGYSNFNYVLNLNIDIVKLDSSLVENLNIDPKSELVVKNVTKVSQALNLEVIAEKVHNQAIEDMLTQIGVDYLQGFHIGKPEKDILEKEN